MPWKTLPATMKFTDRAKEGAQVKRSVAFVLSIASVATLTAAAQAHHKPGHQGGAQTIGLQRDRWPFEGNWVDAGTDTTDAQGDYSFTARPPVNTRYRTRRSGINPSVAVSVGVRIRVSRAVSDRTPEVGQRVRFRGRACPQHDGALVSIERFNRTTNRWRTVRRTTLRDIPGSSCSRYRRTFPVFRDGTYRVVVISPHGDHRNGISRRIRLDAHS